MIPQARLLRIVNALDRAISYYTTTAKETLQLCANLRATSISPATELALQAIEAQFLNYEIALSPENTILQVERNDYHHTHKRNDYERRRRQLLSGKSDFAPLNRLTATPTPPPMSEPLAPPRFTAAEQSAILDRPLGANPTPPSPANTYNGTLQVTYQDADITVESDPPPDFDGDQAFGAPITTPNEDSTS